MNILIQCGSVVLDEQDNNNKKTSELFFADNFILIPYGLCAPCSQPYVMANGERQEAMAVQGRTVPDEMSEEAFLKDLYLNMKKRDTPIERVPHLGFKQSKYWGASICAKLMFSPCVFL